MGLSEAAFAGHIDSLLGQSAITTAFARIRKRAVNVKLENEFPLLAVWIDGDDVDPNQGGDDNSQRETECGILVAAKLADGDSQYSKLGQLMKVVQDTVENMAVSGVEYELSRWDAESNAADGEGDRVWAGAALLVRHFRPRGNF